MKKERTAGYIKKAVNWFRQLSGKKKGKEHTFPLPFPDTPQQDTVTPENPEQIYRLILQESRPRSRRHPEIRCIPVKNFAEAYRFFIRLCDQRYLIIHQAAGTLHYRMQLSDGTVLFDFSAKTAGKPAGTIAVLKINEAASGEQITEIEFFNDKTGTT